mmetsp:Transcript_9894/g.22848  ORF Transcript_9894/g.22848 Transcript_9894/m.22848 type:complete len:207 (-) Transcript_9894:1478-2098(-)
MPRSLIFQYFNTLSTQQQEQFARIGPVYHAWNKKINLISRKDIHHLYLKHILHTLSIAKVVSLKPNARVLDVGTGGGFPGIPLAILFPKTRFYLIDSVGKKIRTVQHIAEELGLPNVYTQQRRAENMKGKYDFVVGRAVTKVAAFYDWVKDNIAPKSQHGIPNGILYFTGNTPLQVPTKYRIYTIADFFDDPFFASKQLVHLMHCY